MNKEEKGGAKIDIELDHTVAEGKYANLVVIKTILHLNLF